MDLAATIILPEYCERVSGSFFGEPLNLFTNLLFILSGLLAWLYVDRTSVSHKRFLKALATLVGLIGLGSFIFHGIPTQYTILLDVIPIYIFIALSLVLVLYMLISSWWYAISLASIFAGILISASMLLPPQFLNGSIRHILTLVLTTLLFVVIHRKYNKIANYLIPVIGVYTLAITARSIDQYACSVLPIGTHFLWHALNALASYLVIIFLVKLSQRNTLKL